RLQTYNYIDARENLELALRQIFKELKYPYPSLEYPEKENNKSANNTIVNVEKHTSKHTSVEEVKEKRNEILYYLQWVGTIIAALSLIIAIVFGILELLSDTPEPTPIIIPNITLTPTSSATHVI